MYKRKVRVVFLCVSHPHWSKTAEYYANSLAPAWLEGRSLDFVLGPALDEGDNNLNNRYRENYADKSFTVLSVPSLSLLTWADLVVTLDQQAFERCPALPSTTRRKHWPIDEIEFPTASTPVPNAFQETVQAEIKRRVEGVIGGILLLAKSDGTIIKR